MTYEQQMARKAELRAEDPHGRMSGNDIDRIVMIEDLNDRIDAVHVSDNSDDNYDLKSILRDMLGLL